MARRRVARSDAEGSAVRAGEEQRRPGIRQGYNEVLPLIEGDVVLTFSPDGNSVPELIPDLVAKINEGYDMVIASRYLGPARSDILQVGHFRSGWMRVETT